jgi:hypothetical protein
MRPSAFSCCIGLVSAASLAAVACADWRGEPKTKPTVAPAPVPSVTKTVLAPIPPVRDECFPTDTTETAAMQCAQGAASRIADTLQILLATGKVRRRVDRPVQGEMELFYRYAGRIGGSSGGPAYHVLSVHANDSNWMELINALTGDSLAVNGQPIISPDGARFAVQDMSAFDTCEGSSALEVWGIIGDKPVKEFGVKPLTCGTLEGWGPSGLTWRSRDSISFLRNTAPKDSAQRARQETDTTRVLLVHRLAGWELVPKP